MFCGAGFKKFRLYSLMVFAGTIILSGCSTNPFPSSEPVDHLSVLVLPFKNLTSTPEAGQTLSALLISSLTIHHVMSLSSASPGTMKDVASIADSGALPQSILDTLAKERIDAVLFGNVTEYEYRLGLSTEPVVGFTWKMISTRTGRTIWSGAVSQLDSCFWYCHDTLSEFGKKLVDSQVEDLMKND